MKIVINNCHGGFGLSREAFLRLRELNDPTAVNEPDYGEYFSDGSGPREGWSIESFCSEIPRDSFHLLQVIGELGEGASGNLADLKIVEIPDDVEWQIEEYDGLEWVAERHRIWS